MTALQFALRLIACAALAAWAVPGAGQQYPSKPIRILTPFPAGSGVDIIARLIATPLSQSIGQPVVVDNRGGAGGTIACEVVAKSPPDGYTLLLGNTSVLAMGPGLYPNAAYDPVKSFAPLTLVATSNNVLVSHPSVPAKTVKELLSLARAKPRALNYGTSGSGSSPHLAAELFKSMAGVRIEHVPYKGSAQMMIDLLSGRIELSFSSLVSSIPYLKQNRLRALGVTSRARSALLPDVPTIDESGLKGFEVLVWQGVVAPAGTPPAVVALLNRQITAVVQMPITRELLANQGLDPATSTPEEFGAMIATDLAKWNKVIKEAKITAD